MKVVRALEVWEKGMEGGFLGHLPLADTVSPAFLFDLFKHEQDKPDPDMKLSYMLDAARIAALQPYVGQQLDIAQFDYILTAYGVPDY
ncbi:hypothetical protein SAMN02745857_02544 [Andreprevotia lacus DSM 23236]|jgi:hypothetical protein|uniref:Uncharacterized protein n=1 Tax=Andreprevotia lacus DSM 23236 TaxID=1121001 RepID=A0A1W1XRJ8_9NEIS|nr:hypothetical protein [Andreprevotia lacus]SMC26599.1 hypothetical protein SAMN02745857_02544 [Andreprevotia lacus DSM 23236]